MPPSYSPTAPSGPEARTSRAGSIFSGAKTQWRRTRARAGVEGFRFHDFRHDLGTKLLRETGNLKLVQRALNHADLKTTTRYAHVLDTEIAEALGRVQAAQQSRNKSRSPSLKVS